MCKTIRKKVNMKLPKHLFNYFKYCFKLLKTIHNFKDSKDFKFLNHFMGLLMLKESENPEKKIREFDTVMHCELDTSLHSSICISSSHCQ